MALGQPSVGWDRMMAVKERAPLILYLPAHPLSQGLAGQPLVHFSLLEKVFSCWEAEGRL